MSCLGGKQSKEGVREFSCWLLLERSSPRCKHCEFSIHISHYIILHAFFLWFFFSFHSLLWRWLLCYSLIFFYFVWGYHVYGFIRIMLMFSIIPLFIAHGLTHGGQYVCYLVFLICSFIRIYFVFLPFLFFLPYTLF